MFKNYIKVAWRNLLKDRQFTFLNLVGLSTGLACAFLIYLWVNDEWSVDKFNANDDRLYQVMMNDKDGDGIRTTEYTPGILAETLAREMPEVESATSSISSASEGQKTTLSVSNNDIIAAGQFAGKDFFNIFSYRLLEGDKSHVLTDNRSILLSESLAMKLFNTTQNVVGKMVTWQHQKEYVVSGVFENVPASSTMQFDFLLPYQIFLDAHPWLKGWGSSDPATYVLLKKGVNPGEFNQKITGLLKSKNSQANGTLFIRRFSSGYLHGHYENGVQAGGRIEYVRLFSIIAIFILVIACINFMNLSTAKASKRLKEIGIRKVSGATRSMLIFQYLGESMLITFLSLILAVVIVVVLLPEFNEITGKHLSLKFTPALILPLLGISLFTGLVSGWYPAFYLSDFNPVAVLKGKLKNSVGELWVRQGLVIFQFALSVVLIISVVAVYKQIKYIQAINMGYQRDHVLSFDMGGANARQRQEFLFDAKKNISGVVDASSMDHGSILGDYGTTYGLQWGGAYRNDLLQFGNIGANYGLIETLGIEMAAGRSFSREKSADSSEVIFNETAIKAMQLKDPVGREITMWGRKWTIAGVAKDFHFESLHENIKPFVFTLDPLNTITVMVKIRAGEEKETIGRLQTLYRQYNPGFPFDYKFLDQDYDTIYASESRIAVLSRYFAGLAILISCLGLFGLTAFTAQRRQKEIGIRKTIGASVNDVVIMFSKDFMKLVLIAVLVAFPIAWWATNQWLSGFAYRTSIGFGVFLISGAITLLIALFTISFQAIKAALADPVRSLKTE